MSIHRTFSLDAHYDRHLSRLFGGGARDGLAFRMFMSQYVDRDLEHSIQVPTSHRPCICPMQIRSSCHSGLIDLISRNRSAAKGAAKTLPDRVVDSSDESQPTLPAGPCHLLDAKRSIPSLGGRAGPSLGMRASVRCGPG